MRRKISSLLILMLILALTIQCAKEEQQVDIDKVRSEIEQTWEQFKGSWEKGDASASAAFFTEDGINMPFYGSTQKGRKEIETFIANGFSANKYKVINLKTEEVFAHGDMAYEFGTIEQTLTPHNGGESITFKGRYISVLKKQSDGSWKFYRWMAQSEQ